MKSLTKVVFPSFKGQLTIPNGDKLLPVADFTHVLLTEHKLSKCSVLQYDSLMQHLVAPVSIKALQIVDPTLVGKVVPCSEPIITSSALSINSFSMISLFID